MYSAQLVIERVQSKLKKCGITQKQMLSDCGIAENTLKRMSDDRGISCFYLAKIADYIDVSVDYLLGRSALPSVSNAKMPEDCAALVQAFQSLSDTGKAKILEYAEMLSLKEASDNANAETKGA